MAKETDFFAQPHYFAYLFFAQVMNTGKAELKEAFKTVKNKIKKSVIILKTMN